MIKFKNSKGQWSIRQGNQPKGQILTDIGGGGILYAIRKDDTGSLCEASLDFTALEVNNTGHIKSLSNDIDFVTSNGTLITTATTTTPLAALQDVYFYRLYSLYICNFAAAIEIAGWNFQKNGEPAASRKYNKSYGQNQDLMLNFLPGYVDLAPGTALSIITDNGSAQLEWTIGYSLIRVGVV